VYLLATCKGGGFQNRRDYAVISLFKDAGIRLSELAGLGLSDVSPASREAVVTGKGDRQRTVRFTYDTARRLTGTRASGPGTSWRESRRCGSACAAAC
jgi:YD repeat-containing protein